MRCAGCNTEIVDGQRAFEVARQDWFCAGCVLPATYFQPIGGFIRAEQVELRLF